MADVESTAQERALALRTEALEICDRFAWLPQCIGSGTFEAGVREIYAELRLLQKVRAVYVSQELIDCCRRHRQWSPLFEDVQARIWMFLGEYERADACWKELVHHEARVMRVMATKTLDSLQRKVDSGEQLATEVDQALDRSATERLVTMLLDALLEDNDLPNIKQVLEVAALQWPMPAEMPWDRDLFTTQLLLDLFEQQLQDWEHGDGH